MTVLSVGLCLLVVIALSPFLIEALRRPMDDAARQKAEGDFVQLSQGITHYQWLGPMRGPVAVCVHGLTTPSYVWRGVAAGLALMGFRVLIYDLYGRGYSDRTKGLQDREFFLTQLNDLLDSQDVQDDITVLGYSMGGAIATAFAAANPGKIRRLILLAPAGMGSGAGKLLRFVVDKQGVGDWLMQAMYPRMHRRGCEAERNLPSSVEGIVDLQLEELWKRGFIAAILSSLRGLLSDDFEQDHRSLGREGVPVLVVWGEDDAVIPISALGQLAKWNRAAHQEVIEGAGHGLPYTHTDQVMEFVRAEVRQGLK